MNLESTIVNELFEKVYPTVRNYSGVSSGRHRATIGAVQHVVDLGLDGDFVECGVFRGASVMAMAMTLLELGETRRKIYLYDSFEGMPNTTAEDGEQALQYVQQFQRGENHGCLCDEENVRRNIFSTGYPQENFMFVRGLVENTIPNKLHQDIAILRLDTDWYKSTQHELIFLFPLLRQGGVLLLDDYWLWPGQKRATDEYFQKHGLKLDNLIRTDSGVYFVK